MVCYCICVGIVLQQAGPSAEDDFEDPVSIREGWWRKDLKVRVEGYCILLLCLSSHKQASKP